MSGKNYLRISTLLVAILIISLSSCDPGKKYEKEEQAQIQDYLSRNSNLNFELKPSGLYYLDELVGTGRTPVTHDTAYMMYTGKFLNGTTFETNYGTTDTLIFPVGENWLTIQGLDEAVTYMKEGGKALTLIPSSLAFGSMGTYTIGGHTPILVEAYLVRIAKGPLK
jgi:FKBP-type peptidyl-prolyl cis-trans isomerase FkpA